jgi:hypothetical protein
MKLIDRYVYAVTERLPVEIREDVNKELHANIEDMLPENAEEDDVKKVLEKLGDPVKLANEYNPTRKYLIGPDIYDTYISVLKLVISIVTIVLVFVTLIEEVVNPSANEELIKMSIEIFTNLISTAIQGVVQGFLWVTLVFVIIERTGVNEGKIPFIKKKWSIDDLPEVSVTNKRKISRVETAFSMFFSMLFLIIIYYQPQLIGIYEKNGNGITLSAPLFIVERLQSYIFIIILVAFLGFGIQIWKFIAMKWSVPLAIANTIYNLASCILVLLMISDGSLLNQSVISSLANLTEVLPSQLTNTWQWGIRVSIAVLILVTLGDSINGFVKCKRIK